MPSRCGLRPRSSGTRSIARAESSSTCQSVGSPRRAVVSAAESGRPSTPTRSSSVSPASRTSSTSSAGRWVYAVKPPGWAGGRSPVLSTPGTRSSSWGSAAYRPIGDHAVEPGRPARDHGREDDPARSDDASGLGQGAHPISALPQVVERAQQQHGIRRRHRPGRARERRPPLTGSPRPPATAAGHVQLHQVAMLDPVPETGQPERVPARPATDVSHHSGCRRKATQQDLLGALQLQRALGGLQPAALLAPVVVVLDLIGVAHAPTLPNGTVRGERIPDPRDRLRVDRRPAPRR